MNSIVCENNNQSYVFVKDRTVEQNDLNKMHVAENNISGHNIGMNVKIT